MLGEILGNSRFVMFFNVLGDMCIIMLVRIRRFMFCRICLIIRVGKYWNYIDLIGIEYCNYWLCNEEYFVGVVY